MSKTVKQVFNLNDQAIEVLGLVNNSDPDNPVAGTTATVTATMTDKVGAAIAEITALALPHISGGDYRGFVADTISLPLGAGYTLTIDGDDSGVKFHYVFEIEVVNRTK